MSSFPQRFSLFIVALVVAVLATAGLVIVGLASVGLAPAAPAAAQSPSTEPAANPESTPEPTPEPPPVEPAPDEPLARGLAAIDRLGRQITVVAEAYRLDVDELRDRLVTEPALAIDRSGNLIYVDPVAPGDEVAVFPFEPAPSPPSPPTSPSPPPSSPLATADDPGDSLDSTAFELASLPGAELTIYLDFDGHVTKGTIWNSAFSVATIDSPPFDLDGDPGRWSAEELEVITTTWAQVAEDFDPWNVNVTTVAPPVDDLQRSGADDGRWGARVVVTTDTGVRCGCGGLTALGAFDGAVDEPTFVFHRAPDVLAEAATHQVGHLLGVTHDGSTIGPVTHRLLGLRPDSGPAPDAEPEPDPDSDSGPDSDPGTSVDGNGDSEPPASPSGLVGADIGGTVFLGWAPNDEPDLVAYEVAWSADIDGPFVPVATVGLNGHLDLAPIEGENHYEVTARDASGNASAPATVTVRLVAGIGLDPGTDPASR